MFGSVAMTELSPLFKAAFGLGGTIALVVAVEQSGGV